MSKIRVSEKFVKVVEEFLSERPRRHELRDILDGIFLS